jgi:nucleotidyltransferase substrate binding protein (TIGR01987 family)
MGKIENALKIKHKKALDAILTLKTALDGMENVDKIAKSSGESSEENRKTFRDSLVQRFEYTFDLTWKCLNLYLETEGRKLEIKSPKSVFRESLKFKLLSADEVRLAIEMVDNRNLTTHGYDEELIERISKQIHKYYQLMNLVLNKILIK